MNGAWERRDGFRRNAHMKTSGRKNEAEHQRKYRLVPFSSRKANQVSRKPTQGFPYEFFVNRDARRRSITDMRESE